MRVFEKMNTDSSKNICPVCNTRDQKPVVLVGIDGTERENIIQAVQVHLDCIDLTMCCADPNYSVFYQKFLRK